MSTKYKRTKEVPTEILVARLKELADAITKGREAVDREFTMRVPAECDRDADLVLVEAARRLEMMGWQPIETIPKGRLSALHPATDLLYYKKKGPANASPYVLSAL